MEITLDIELTDHANKLFDAVSFLTGMSAKEILTTNIYPIAYTKLNTYSYNRKREGSHKEDVRDGYTEQYREIGDITEKINLYRHSYEMLLDDATGDFKQALSYKKTFLERLARLVGFKKSKYRDAMIHAKIITEDGLRLIFEVERKRISNRNNRVLESK